MADDILIVGGGFAGFWAAMAARRVTAGKAHVTMVSREPVLAMRPRLYEANPELLGFDLLPALDAVGVSFIRGEATGLDLAGNCVALASGTTLAYARLVVATGSVMRRPPIPGAETAYSIDIQSDAISFDRRLAEIVRTKPRPTIAIIGAGFTGIELALELRDRFALHGGDSRSLTIILVDRAATVGAGLGPSPRSEIVAALAAAQVECRLGETLTALGTDQITFASGAVLGTDAVVFTTGMVAAGFVRHIPGQRDALGRIVVDRFLRAPAAPAVFVTGDAAAADTGDGHRALQSCQHALQLGRFAGENAARDILGMPSLPYSQPRYVTCLDLGRSGAVLTQGWNREVTETGAGAKARKRWINTELIYPPANVSGATLLALSSTDPATQQLPR